MPLPLPVLDDRTFDQLVLEARDLLPAAAPAWTDHNASDPGITLLELLAYVAEIGSYRLDRVPATERRAFLRLLGAAPRAARTASTVVALEQRTASNGAIAVPARTQIGGVDGAVVFQTTAAVNALGAKLTTVLVSASGEIVDRTPSNETMAAPFAPFGPRPSGGDALLVGFDRPLGPAATRVRLYVFGADTQGDAETWSALAAEARAARRDVRRTCPESSVRGLGRYWEHYGARTTWEYYDTSGAWKPLRHQRDRTRALTISGSVRFDAPGSAAHAAGGVPTHPGSFFIRCRVEGAEYDCAPAIRGLRVNAAPARHAVDVAAESPGASFGHASQIYRLQHRPVVARSTHVDVVLPGGGRDAWIEVSDWDRSGPGDRHYVLDADAGAIAFGDGRQGRVPSTGATIAVRYRAGGGQGGNVASQTLVKLLPAASPMAAALAVSQPIAAHGGVDREAIEKAEGRAARVLATVRCAVTLADFERYALSTPGVPIARAHAVAGFHPRLTCLPAAGSVTVVIVPACVDVRPEPSAALCRAVEAWLDRRRPIATEVHVVGPRYIAVTVRARLHPARGADRSTIGPCALGALNRYFHPLHGGAARTGWPIGRPVYRSEVLALLASVAGVTHVDDLELRAGSSKADHCGNVDICPDGLVLSGRHEIDVA